MGLEQLTEPRFTRKNILPTILISVYTILISVSDF